MDPTQKSEGDIIALLYRHYTQQIGALGAAQEKDPTEFRRGQIETIKVLLRDLNRVRPMTISRL